MLYYSLAFLLAAFVSATLGFGALTGTAAFMAQGFFYIFLALFVVGLCRRKKIQKPVPGSYAQWARAEAKAEAKEAI